MKKTISLILCAVLTLCLFGCANTGGSASREATLIQNLVTEDTTGYPFCFEDFEWLATQDEVLAAIHARGIPEDHISQREDDNSGEAMTYLYLSTREKNPFKKYKASELITIYKFMRTDSAAKYKLIAGDYCFVEPDDAAMQADKTAISTDLAAMPGELSLLNAGNVKEPSAAEGCVWILSGFFNGVDYTDGAAQYCPNPDPRMMQSSFCQNGELMINVSTWIIKTELNYRLSSSES